MAFDPKTRMAAPFRAFMEAAEDCAAHGYLVFIRPDDARQSGWAQQIYIIEEGAQLAPRRADIIAYQEVKP